MPWWTFFIIVPVGGLALSMLAYGINHRIKYHCSMFNDKITTWEKAYYWASDEKRFHSFDEAYQRHCSWKTNKFTEDIPFSTFKSLYTVNPERWTFKKSLCWDNSNYFHLEYVTKPNAPEWSRASSTIRVIFNEEDFEQFLWFIVEEIENEKNEKTREADKRSRDIAQELIHLALDDITKLEEQAEKERAEAEKITTEVKKSIHAKINERSNCKNIVSYWEDKVP